MLVAPFGVELLIRSIAYASDAPVATVPARVVYEFRDTSPELFESIVVDPSGNLYVSLLTRGEIRRITPAGDQQLVAALPTGPFRLRDFDGFLGALAIGPDGDLFASVGARDRRYRGVWRIDAAALTDLSDPAERAHLFAALPGDAWPNGIAVAGTGEVFVADSARCVIWRVAQKGRAEVWLDHPLLRRSGSDWLPGPNGLQYHAGHLFVSNTSSGQVLQIPIDPEGRAGEPRIYVDGISADDFAFSERGDLFLTTHPLNQVVRVTREGRRTVIATRREGALGPTSAAFGRGPLDPQRLFVLSDGGFLIPTHRGTPNILALDIGS